MKGGTTALYDHMCTHPEISGGTAKEIHYFSLHRDRGLDWYAEQFTDVPDNVMAIDASPTYFDLADNRAIPAHIKAILPEAHLFLIVRDPIARAVSHFHHLKTVVKNPALANLTADEFFSQDFSRALTQEDPRAFALYLALGFSAYLPRFNAYNAVFGRDALTVLTNAELLKKPEGTMRRVFDKLGLKHHVDPSFGAFRHSTGSDIGDLSVKNFNRLAELLYPSYKTFCDLSKLEFTPLAPPRQPRSRQAAKIENDVHIGHDGWLFLIGGSNNALDLYSAPRTPFTPDIREDWVNLLTSRQNRAAAFGARYMHLIAPEKLSVYPEYFRGELDTSVRPGAQLRRHMTGELAELLVDPVAFFGTVKNNAKLYWKTDTHWTFFGCFAAYQLLMTRLGLPFDRTLQGRPFSEGDLTFDLGGKLATPQQERGRFYRVLSKARRIHANPLVTFQESNRRFSESELHVGTQVVFRNDDPGAIERKVVLFGDSFSEYRPHLLSGLLAETFRETHFLWTASVDFDYARRVGADIVISEGAERFMSRVPSDDQDFDAFVRTRMQKFGIVEQS